MATMQLQMQGQTRQVVARSAPRAFVAAPVSRKVAVQRSAAAAPISRSRTVVKATAEAKEAAPAATGRQHWYACVASAEFFYNDCQNEAFAEQLREKKRWYDEQDKPMDFYMVSQPAWLESKFPDLDKRVRKPAVALVATDKTWIVFMKLRLDRVLQLDLGEMTAEEVTQSMGDIPEFKNPMPPMPYAPYAHGWWKVFERK